MKKKILYVALGLMGIMGTLSVGVASAANTSCWSDYTTSIPSDSDTYATGIVYGCDGDIPIITIYGKNGNNEDVGITIKAMNEGAEKIGSGDNAEAFGRHYQWGNNYGFPLEGNILTGNSPVNASTYGPSNYYSGSTFIKLGQWDSSDNYNLWGGSGDKNTGNQMRGFNTGEFKVINSGARQAMCPEGFHVPSAGEWNALLYLWINNLSGENAVNLNSFINREKTDIGNKLSHDMQLPFAGFHNSNSDVPYFFSSYYASSSKKDPSSAQVLQVKTYQIQVLGASPGMGTSVRCFKNLYVEQAPSIFTLTFTDSGQGSISTGSVEAEEGASISRDDGVGTVTISGTVVATGIANEGYVFSGWLTDCAGPTVTAACSFTGEFKPITYNVQFTGTDVSGTMANQEFTYDVAQKLTGNAFTKTGYTFSGWTDGSTGYTNQQNVINLTTTNNDIITFTAQWTPITYTIAFSGNSDDVIGTQASITAEYDSGDIAPESSFTRTGYTFSGWNTQAGGSGTGYATGDTLINLSTTGGDVVTLYAQWTANIHKLSFVVDGTTIQSGDVAYSGAILAPTEPKKDCNSFAGWTSSVEGLTTTGTMPDSDVTFTANWNYTCSRSSGGGGGGSSRNTEKTTETQTGSKVDSSTKATDTEDNTQDSSAEDTEGQNQGKTYSDEFQQAYEFAYKHGITTMPTIEQANMEGPLTRIAMAKMLSYYAINVLGLKPDETRVNKFNDVSDQMDAEYNNAVILAYQLGIMGINMPKNNFRPNDLVTRGEFATALSRMLYKIADGKDKYYSTHLAKLMEEKIITNDNPDLQELRGYVMIMLMRSAK